MPFRPLLVAVLLSLTACSTSSVPYSATFAPTPDPLTRLVPSGPTAILEAGTATLRRMGFDVDSPSGGATRVYSQPLIIQTTWRGAPVARRVLCGIGTAAMSEPNRVTQLSNTIPIELYMGFEVEPRAGTTATTIQFSAQGRRSAAEVLTSPTMSCTLTVPFVNELFAAIEGELAAALRGANTPLPVP